MLRCGVAAVRVLQRAEGHSGDGGGSQGLLMNGSAQRHPVNERAGRGGYEGASRWSQS